MGIPLTYPKVEREMVDSISRAMSIAATLDNPAIASHMVEDYRRTRLGKVLAAIETRFDKPTGASARASAGTPKLHVWARREGLSPSVVDEVFLDYWFLYTVLEVGAAKALRSGVDFPGFLRGMNPCFDRLRSFCAGLPTPRLDLDEQVGNRFLLTFYTPRPYVPELIPGFIRRAGHRFLTKPRLKPVPGSTFPTWRLRV
jgi:hypothetical protein